MSITYDNSVRLSHCHNRCLRHIATNEGCIDRHNQIVNPDNVDKLNSDQLHRQIAPFSSLTAISFIG